MLAERARRSLPGLWAGLMLAIGFVAAPTLFALLDRAAAGRVASRLFAIEATASIVLCVVLALLERGRAARGAAAGEGSRVTAELMLVLGALFCTVLGHHAIQPMMDAARAGQGAFSFGVLHGVSSALYAVKLLLVATLAWRASAGP
ncbi:MAG TPA: DUF4149 domain-containing protein [Methylibium sp.]|uniref:DUF4149 domain-containing protein n=1 Tax=Methylibium sp. TaxID=2067992 RepID=UPI002DBD16F6|nr:DUF4149 domain-containing protein [Methylibium sp.]HEU4459055.1 DUF4149 domain-containing protein [Methylibium sp.]